MKTLLILLFLLTSGCGAWDRFTVRMTGDASEICIDGVKYYQFTSGASVAYNKDGSVKVCK